MSDPKADSREELEQTAIMLEQILEVMPDDLFTLRALYETSLKLEHPEKAFETLTRLDDQSRAAQNGDMIEFVINQYKSIAEDSSEVQGRIMRLKEVRNVPGLIPDEGGPDLPPVEKPLARPAGAGGGGRMEAEMALAWELFQDEQLSQEEYANVLHDLTEMSSQTMGVPVTVLHILHDRQFSRMERLMTHLCQKNEMPIMVLSQFEGNEELAQHLPVEFTSANGAIPFAKVGDDLLLGVLNPMDKELLAEAQKQTGKRCHPYLVAPEDYDQFLEKIKLAAV
jgi:hypothetical protein